MKNDRSEAAQVWLFMETSIHLIYKHIHTRIANYITFVALAVIRA
jgi:hypothetical protein